MWALFTAHRAVRRTPSLLASSLMRISSSSVGTAMPLHRLAAWLGLASVPLDGRTSAKLTGRRR